MHIRLDRYQIVDRRDSCLEVKFVQIYILIAYANYSLFLGIYIAI